jgi:hypothetical protein
LAGGGAVGVGGGTGRVWGGEKFGPISQPDKAKVSTTPATSLTRSRGTKIIDFAFIFNLAKNSP